MVTSSTNSKTAARAAVARRKIETDGRLATTPLPWVERLADHLAGIGWHGFEQHDLDDRAALLAVAPVGGEA